MTCLCVYFFSLGTLYIPDHTAVLRPQCFTLGLIKTILEATTVLQAPRQIELQLVEEEAVLIPVGRKLGLG